MTVAIIDYGSGNLRSAAKAFERSVDDAGLAIASGQRDWGRYVYAGLAVVVMAAVWVYVQKIDQALAETSRPPLIQAVEK